MASNIKRFIEHWKNKGDEKSDTQSFWFDLLHDVLNIERPSEFINFEKRVELEHMSFIDAYVPSTRVIIEQKSKNINLSKPALQSDGTLKTPFEQSKRYSDWLPVSERANWIITCNFQEIRIHDMEKPKADPEIIQLSDLEKQKEKLQFIIDLNASKPKEIHEAEISLKAGELVGKLYEALLKRYKNPESDSSLKSLNILCVRIVFLLFAEDIGIFKKSAFHDYISKYKNNPRGALIDLFTVLSQKIETRDPYISSDLMSFPYVNGGLFNDDVKIEIPNLEGEPLDIIIHEMSEGFDWSTINPPIFGAIFESTLQGETRKLGGMHYTTLKNIHKVIDPLFLNKLKSELDKLLLNKPNKDKLTDFRKKLSSYKFFDPACGSGNFLTETYCSLCELEMKVIQILGEIPFHQVSINQFYGIEINDFAVSVTKTALWIADIQMSKKINPSVDLTRECLPLENYDNIREGNALKTDWQEIIKPSENVYIISNPPFMGYSNQTKEQKQDILSVYIDETGKSYKTAGKIDYVAGWYFKAAEFMKNTNVKAAFVSTNSITQG